jgi:catechol 2,3-dioxygenase-like lactoylglutathione lyase family enzyme
MAPNLNGIDHLHVYVSSLDQAEAWFETVLSLTRVESQMNSVVKGGPLILENTLKNIHLALFEREKPELSSTIAFGAGGNEFLVWKQYLEDQGLDLRVTDHTSDYSMYFKDPDGNLYEITTDERDYVAEQLN